MSDPFELALWLGAVAAAGRHPTYLDGVLPEPAIANVLRWPPYAVA